MSGTRGRGAPAVSNRNQPQPKKGQDNKQVKKQWAAEDYVTETVSIEEVREVKSAFDIFDSDSSGVVDPIQLKNAFVSLGFAATNKFVYNILNDLDTENVGGLTFQAFLKLATGTIGQTHSKAEINDVFKSFDLDKRGKIDAQQFKQVAIELGENLSDQEVDKIFQKVDANNTGYITAEDFYAVMCHKANLE